LNPGRGLERHFLDYKKDKKAFEKWMKARCSSEHVDSLLSYLDKYLSEPISNPRRLFELIEDVVKGKRQFSMGVRDLLKYYEAFSLMDEAELLKYRKVVKIPRTKVDNYVPDDHRVISAYRLVNEEKYKILFKLLTFSGIRLKESIYLLNIYDADKVITNDSIARYPLNLERGTKRVFYAYMPEEFSKKISRLELDLVDAQQYLGRRLPAKYLRKWHFNFLILNNVPESVADFIQGRAPSTVGSMHYLAKVKQADEWYAKVIPKLLSLFPAEDTYASHPAAEWRTENRENNGQRSFASPE
jgi:intergrase/recombinase